MKRFLAGAAISVALVTAACTGAGPRAAGMSVGASSTSSAIASGSTSTPNATVSVSPREGVMQQGTPEEAMRSWLRAMLAGDTKAVCALMASNGKAIAEVPQAVETCSGMIGTMLDQLRPLAPQFTGLAVSGATITGDTATFENATTKPAMAAQIIKAFKAVRIDGKWYVTQG